jgi:hypothetical protein
MGRESRQTAVFIMPGRGIGIHGNDQSPQARVPEFPDAPGIEQGPVGAQDGLDFQLPAAGQDLGKLGIEKGFPAGEGDVTNARLSGPNQPFKKSFRVRHNPFRGRDLGKIAKPAPGIAGVGHRDLAETRASLEN